MNKVIIFLCLIGVLTAQINNTASAQTDPNPAPTSYPDTGPIEAGPKPTPTPKPTGCGAGCTIGARCGGAFSAKRCNSKCVCTEDF